MSKTTKKKNPVGRPDKYKPEFCDYIKKWGKDGETAIYWAERLNINKSTLYYWREKYPDFSDAFSLAMQSAEVWFLRKGKDGLTSDRFRDSLYKFKMVSIFRGEYVQRSEQSVEVTTKEFTLAYKDDVDE